MTQYAAWPASSDVLAFLTSTGLFAPALASGGLATALADLSDQALMEIDVAVQTVQEWTGWIPFLAAEQTRTFDPPGPEKGPALYLSGLSNMGGDNRLFLRCGLISLTDGHGAAAATITTCLTADNRVGRTLTLGRDFWLMPGSSPQYNRPYTMIKFRTVQYGEPQSIAVTGLWGFAQALPSPVWRSAVKLAAAALAPLVDLRVNRGMLSRKAGDEEERYSGGRDAGPVAAAAAQWREDAELLIRRGNYLRVTL